MFAPHYLDQRPRRSVRWFASVELVGLYGAVPCAFRDLKQIRVPHTPYLDPENQLPKCCATALTWPRACNTAYPETPGERSAPMDPDSL